MTLEFAKHFFGGKTSCKHILEYYKCDFVEQNIQQLQPFIQLQFFCIHLEFRKHEDSFY